MQVIFVSLWDEIVWFVYCQILCYFYYFICFDFLFGFFLGVCCLVMEHMCLVLVLVLEHIILDMLILECWGWSYLSAEQVLHVFDLDQAFWCLVSCVKQISGNFGSIGYWFICVWVLGFHFGWVSWWMVFNFAAMQSQVVCNGCRSLLLYPRGATNVCCALCNTITSVPPPGKLIGCFCCCKF